MERLTRGKRLKKLRKDKGMTLEELLGLIKIINPSNKMTVAMLSRYENDVNYFTLTNMINLADALECSIDYLLERTDDPHPELTLVYQDNPRYKLAQLKEERRRLSDSISDPKDDNFNIVEAAKRISEIDDEIKKLDRMIQASK